MEGVEFGEEAAAFLEEVVGEGFAGFGLRGWGWGIQGGGGCFFGGHTLLYMCGFGGLVVFMGEVVS